MKRFCIMGILWNFEWISYAVYSSETDEERRNRHDWYWMIFDGLNIFQAIAIFFIFIWKHQVKTALQAQYPYLASKTLINVYKYI